MSNNVVHQESFDMDLKIVKQTIEPNIDSLGNQYDGNIEYTEYECPCGEGIITLTHEKIPGYRDWWADIECEKCKQEYELQWGKGVFPGDSPMIRKRYS